VQVDSVHRCAAPVRQFLLTQLQRVPSVPNQQLYERKHTTLKKKRILVKPQILDFDTVAHLHIAN
jgi:hypothetical protein